MKSCFVKSRDQGKIDVSNASIRPRSAFQKKNDPTPPEVVKWPEIARALANVETRDLVMFHYRNDGYSPGDLERVRRARESMACALARAEDWLEDIGDLFWRHARQYELERATIREVRRRLEWELWG